jgi:hypothetical protein
VLIPFLLDWLGKASFTDMSSRTRFYTTLLRLVRELTRDETRRLLTSAPADLAQVSQAGVLFLPCSCCPALLAPIGTQRFAWGGSPVLRHRESFAWAQVLRHRESFPACCRPCQPAGGVTRGVLAPPVVQAGTRRGASASSSGGGGASVAAAMADNLQPAQMFAGMVRKGLAAQPSSSMVGQDVNEEVGVAGRGAHRRGGGGAALAITCCMPAAAGLAGHPVG